MATTDERPGAGAVAILGFGARAGTGAGAGAGAGGGTPSATTAAADAGSGSCLALGFPLSPISRGYNVVSSGTKSRSALLSMPMNVRLYVVECVAACVPIVVGP
eukprot:COSAG06_NODE_7312_length_2550_cov_1.630763_1_plen_103_part_10